MVELSDICKCDWLLYIYPLCRRLRWMSIALPLMLLCHSTQGQDKPRGDYWHLKALVGFPPFYLRFCSHWLGALQPMHSIRHECMKGLKGVCSFPEGGCSHFNPMFWSSWSEGTVCFLEEFSFWKYCHPVYQSFGCILTKPIVVWNYVQRQRNPFMARSLKPACNSLSHTFLTLHNPAFSSTDFFKKVTDTTYNLISVQLCCHFGNIACMLPSQLLSVCLAGSDITTNWSSLLTTCLSASFTDLNDCECNFVGMP